MAIWPDVGAVLRQLRELDVESLRVTAETPPRVIIVGADNARRVAVVAALQQGAGPAAALVPWQLLPWPATAETLAPLRNAELVLFLPADESNTRALEQELIRRLLNQQIAVVPITSSSSAWPPFDTPAVEFDSNKPELFGDALATRLAVLLPPERWPTMGRYIPALRAKLAERLVHTTAQNNALYAFSTGLAEILPILDIPLNVADMFVLTKNQALMAYKIALLYGLPSEVQHALTELAGVVGVGFLWRQTARQLVGLIPIWGILPKVAIAYAGTIVTGEAVRVWCASGRRIERVVMNQQYRQALLQGKELAAQLMAKAPRPGQKLRLPSPKILRSKNVELDRKTWEI